MRESANSVAWSEVFEKYDCLETISEQGYVDVQASQLKEFREPRHMGKIDHEENLPKVFAENGLTILTISNSAYRVGPFKIFQPLPEWSMPGSEVSTIEFPHDLETLDHENITSEPSMLNIALASGILQEFCEEELTLTVSGRMRTGRFEFDVETYQGRKQSIEVNNAQMEIDAGYEGRNAFHIFEAKNHSARNFNLRQLYYPTKSWTNRIHKMVNSIFITHSNDVFDVFRFDFEDPSELSSASMTKHRRYMLTHSAPKADSLLSVAKNAAHGSLARDLDRGAPFPQADSFERVIDLVSILIEEPRTVEDLATHFAFDPRQSDYYFNAAKYLGLASSEHDDVSGMEMRYATDKAVSIFALSYAEKYTALATEILSIEPFAKTYLHWASSRERPNVDAVVELFRSSPESNPFAESTLRRRSQTILSWTSWLMKLSS